MPAQTFACNALTQRGKKCRNYGKCLVKLKGEDAVYGYCARHFFSQKVQNTLKDVEEGKVKVFSCKRGVKPVKTPDCVPIFVDSKKKACDSKGFFFPALNPLKSAEVKHSMRNLPSAVNMEVFVGAAQTDNRLKKDGSYQNIYFRARKARYSGRKPYRSPVTLEGSQNFRFYDDAGKKVDLSRQDVRILYAHLYFQHILGSKELSQLRSFVENGVSLSLMGIATNNLAQTMEEACSNFQDSSTLVNWSWLLATIIQVPHFADWIEEEYQKLKESFSFLQNVEFAA